MVKKAKSETTYYVFEGTKPIFEKRITSGKIKSYVYALGKHLARVDGVIGDTNAKVYYYHTDHLGSIRAVTDQTGKVVFQADHMPFGQRFGETGDFEEWHSFTGKEIDPDTGLMYYGARWYDPDIGRFISEDPGRQGLNWHVYCSNNPLNRVDLDGRFWWIVVSAVISGINAQQHGGDFWAGAFVGAVTGAIGWGVSSAFTSMAGAAASNTWVNLAINVGSGAVSGGIISSVMGGDFWEGAGQGALSGFLTWGINQLWGDRLTKWASNDEFKIAGVNAFNSATKASLMGGNPLEAAGYSYVGSVANYYLPKIEAAFTKFDEKNIVKVVILNDPGSAVGHNGILLIDKNGRGMFYSYYPETVDKRLLEGVPGEMRYKDMSPKEVSRLLFKDGIIRNPSVTTKDKEVRFEKYSRFIGMDVDPADGLKMFNKAQEITANPGTYKFLTNNCTQVVGEILKAGGYNYDDIEFNYIPNKVFENMKWQENVHVWQLTK